MNGSRRMRRGLSVGLLAALPLLIGWTMQAASNSDGQNWPHWRGPEGNGISKATGLPTTWSLEKNIAWKTPLPSWSGGTPIIWEDRIFLTSPSKPAEPKAAA